MQQSFGFNVKKFGQSSGIDLNSNNYTKGGIKKEQVNSKYHSIFDKVDLDKNGILDSSEMAAFKSQIDSDKNGFIDKQEAKNFLYNNDDNTPLTYTDAKGKSKELSEADLNRFLAEYMSNEDMGNIQNAEKVEVDGQDAVQITKNDGSKNIIFDDKDEPMRTITTDADTNAVTTDYIKDDIRQKTEVVQENGDSQVTEFEQDGTTPSKQTSVTQSSGKTEVTTYDNGVPAQKDVTVGIKSQHYEYDADGNEYLLQEVENQGHDVLEKVTDYQYNDDGTVLSSTKEAGGKTTVQLRASQGGDLQEETITEQGKVTTNSYENNQIKQSYVEEENGRQTLTNYNSNGVPTDKTIEEANKRSVTLFDDNGKPKEKVTVEGDLENEQYTRIDSLNYKDDGSVQRVVVRPDKNMQTTTDYNANGKKTSQTQIIDGKTYEVEYDGKGNTKILVKAGESLESVAQFANRRGREGYHTNAAEISRMNGGLTNEKLQAGQYVTVKGEFNAASVDRGTTAAAEKAKGDNAETKRVQEGVGQFTETYVQTQFPGGKNTYKSYDEYTYKLIENEVNNGTLPKSALTDKNLQRELSGRISEMNGNQPIGSLKSIKCLVTPGYNKTCQTNEEKNDETNFSTRTSTKMLQSFNKDVAYAVNTFNGQTKNDGWANKAGNKLRWWNNTGEIKEEIREFNATNKRLIEANKNGPAAFEAQFKKEFGVEYNKDKVDKYLEYNSKLPKATAIYAQLETLESTPTTKCLIDKDKSTFNRTYNYYKAHPDDAQIDRDISDQVTKFSEITGIPSYEVTRALGNTKGADRYLALQKVAENYYNGMQDQLKEAVKPSPGYDSFIKSKNEAYREAFGSNNRIVDKVNDYCASQQAGGEVVKGVSEFAMTAAITAATGGAGLGFATAASDMVVEGSDAYSRGKFKEEVGGIVYNSVVDGATTIGVGKAFKAYKIGSRVGMATARAGENVKISKKTGMNIGKHLANATEGGLDDAATNSLQNRDVNYNTMGTNISQSITNLESDKNMLQMKGKYKKRGQAIQFVGNMVYEGAKSYDKTKKT